MTHDGLVDLGALLLSRLGWYGIITEPGRRAEEPDVIGFKSLYGSCIVECKASRKDFLSDRKKWARKRMEDGVGNYRIYLTDAGVVRDESEIPEFWGWAEVVKKDTLELRRRPERIDKLNLKADRNLAISAVYRLVKCPEKMKKPQGMLRILKDGLRLKGSWF